MAGVEIIGTVVEVTEQFASGKPIVEYIDGEAYPAVEVSISQPGFAAYEKDRGMDYYPAKVRFLRSFFADGLPEVGAVVKCLAIMTAKAPKEVGGKVYVNLKGRRLEMAK